ncbi:MAG: cytochrome c [Sphingobacteriales bacterium]|jgi:mono/diheme cytochrome c family protein|nr:cytochrome c [Sphingobacteriales bacterium]
MRKIFTLIAMSLVIASCGGSSNPTEATENESNNESSENKDVSDYDPKRGEGKFSSVELSATLDQTMATDGEAVYGVKCSSCHKTTAEKLVGPGWDGVTTRRLPEWIMNFITNPDPMINKDPEVQAQLEICLVRMPNQGLTDDEARHILEFMRKNDGVK